MTESTAVGGAADAVPPMRATLYRRNAWGFGLGTLGRDMAATLVAMFLIVYLTEVVQVSNAVLAAVTVVLVMRRGTPRSSPISVSARARSEHPMSSSDARIRLKDVYAHPVGRDAIDKILLQLGRSRRWVTNSLVANLSLRTLGKLAERPLGRGLADTLLEIMAEHPERVGADSGDTPPDGP